jgi:hypothetical protein
LANEPLSDSGADAEQPVASDRANHGPDSDEYQSTLAQDLLDAIDECLAYGIDPYPIMIDELRAAGYTVTPPTAADAEQPARPDWERFGLVDADPATDADAEQRPRS